MKPLVFAAVLMMAFPALADDPQRPDPTLTPGAWRTPPTPLAALCRPGYTVQVRNVPADRKREVFREYGIDPIGKRRSYEVDHLVALELDGTNDLTNLWPQSYVSQPMNAYRKDVLENTMKRMVCAGTLALADAQHEIATNWPTAYRKYVLHAVAP